MSHHRDIVVVKRSRQIIDQRLQSLIHGLIFDRENVERKITDLLIQHLATLPQPVPILAAPRKNPRDPSSDDVLLGNDLPKRPRTITREISLPPASPIVHDTEIQDAPLPVPSAPPLSVPLEDWTVHQVNNWSYTPTADFEFKFDPSFGLSRISLNEDELDEKNTEENEAAQCDEHKHPHDFSDFISYEEHVVESRPDILAQCTPYELESYYAEAAKDALERKSRRMLPKQKSSAS